MIPQFLTIQNAISFEESKIPVLGLFFQNKTKSKTYSELMVFITPKILK